MLLFSVCVSHVNFVVDVQFMYVNCRMAVSVPYGSLFLKSIKYITKKKLKSPATLGLDLYGTSCLHVGRTSLHSLKLNLRKSCSVLLLLLERSETITAHSGSICTPPVCSTLQHPDSEPGP